MTIVLPLGSFAPVYALAKVGGLQQLATARLANPDWASLQAPVLDGITQFSVVWWVGDAQIRCARV